MYFYLLKFFLGHRKGVGILSNRMSEKKTKSVYRNNIIVAVLDPSRRAR